MPDIDLSGPPVRTGDEFNVTIDDVGRKGDGLTYIANFVVIVPGTKKGDELKIKITKVNEKCAFAEIVKGEE